MSEERDTICFSCGKSVSEPPRFNLLPSGELCPTCRDRVLDALPPLLPGQLGEGVDGGTVPVGGELDMGDDGDDWGGYPDRPIGA